MAHRLFHGDCVVAGHAREAQPVDGGVDEDRGQLPLAQPGVVTVGSIRAGRTARPRRRPPRPGAGGAARCSPPRSRRLRSGCTAAACSPAGRGRRRPPPRRPGRWGSGAPAGRARRVVRAFAAQLGGSLVAQDVERGEDRLAGRLRDARLLVEHPADGRLADTDLAGYLCESSGHGRNVTQILRKCLQRSRWAQRRGTESPQIPVGTIGGRMPGTAPPAPRTRSMCFDADSHPPIVTHRRAAVDGSLITLTAADGNELLGVPCGAGGARTGADAHPAGRPRPVPLLRGAGTPVRGGGYRGAGHRLLRTDRRPGRADGRVRVHAPRRTDDLGRPVRGHPGRGGPISGAQGRTTDDAAVFVVGFCFGGRLAFDTGALGLGLAGAIGFYGVPIGPRNDIPAPVEIAGESPVAGAGSVRGRRREHPGGRPSPPSTPR